MIYGANGYTGELIAREAKAKGLNPIIAGRNEPKIQSLSKELGFTSRIFDLHNQQALTMQLADVQLVLNCAGPFSSTSLAMIKACIQSGTHYIDITGEISVFEYAQSQNQQAIASNILLCPGVGFDVIPTDCIAAKLKQALPDANYLALGFDTHTSLSPGTAKTAVEGLAQGGKIRSNGKIKKVPLAWKTHNIDFGRGKKLATTIAWGDVSTAYYNTGIPNIEVYIPVSKRKLSILKAANYIGWLLRLSPVQSFLKKKAVKLKGPDYKQLKQLDTFVWGEAKNAKGERKIVRIKTANGYALTVSGSLAVVEFLLKNKVKAGYTTPAQLMGSDFISKLPGSSEVAAGEN